MSAGHRGNRRLKTTAKDRRTDMESWRKVWRDGVEPLLSLGSLEALRRRTGQRRSAALAGGDHDAAAVAMRAGVAGRGRVRPRLLRLGGRRPGDGGGGRGILRPHVLRGGSAPRRAGRLPVVPQLVRRDAARRDAAAVAGGSQPRPGQARTARTKSKRRLRATRSPRPDSSG